ncbi:hypothetical protein HK105_207971 [Polyrhizophydium stewartii]|uniref:Uncharacterized protein n=1 Tax=Polyrhizophydium stewartii TaxID=2732419 RepID=A0ABR4MZ78_9FUNG
MLAFKRMRPRSSPPPASPSAASSVSSSLSAPSAPASTVLPPDELMRLRATPAPGNPPRPRDVPAHGANGPNVPDSPGAKILARLRAIFARMLPGRAGGRPALDAAADAAPGCRGGLAGGPGSAAAALPDGAVIGPDGDILHPAKSHRKMATTRALQHLYYDVCFGSLDLSEIANRYDGDADDLDDATILSTALSGGYGENVRSITSTQLDLARSIDPSILRYLQQRDVKV